MLSANASLLKRLKTCVIAVVTCLVVNLQDAKAQQLTVVNSFFSDQQLTDLVAWRNGIWASTNQGLFSLKPGHARSVAMPAAQNDLITAMYTQSPYALVCGTYKGNLLFISEDDQNYCSVNWELHDPRAKSTFYISSIVQSKSHIWVGSLEKGAYQIDPTSKEMQNFSLDFNDDTLGLNVFDVAVGNQNEIWANSQNGLYFILNIFNDDKLKYIKSSRFKEPFDFMVQGSNGIYGVYQNYWNKNRLVRLGFKNGRVDAKIQERYRLPKELDDAPIKALCLDNRNNLWLLGEQLWRQTDIGWTAYTLPNMLKDYHLIQLAIIDDAIWIGTEFNGVFLLSHGDALLEMEVAKAERPDETEVVRGKLTTLPDVLFEPGDAALMPISHNTLDKLATQLKKDPSSTIVVSGHTALDGDSTYLYQLSLLRAQSVKNYLIDQGIKPERITTLGFGATQLQIPSEPKSGKNRRVEVLLK